MGDENIQKLITAAGGKCAPFWPKLFANLLKDSDVTTLLGRVGKGSGAPSPRLAQRPPPKLLSRKRRKRKRKKNATWASTCSIKLSVYPFSGHFCGLICVPRLFKVH